jgi:hypothetical protein
MLAAKSINTGCPLTTGNAILLYSHATLEHDGFRSTSHIGEKHRGQRTLCFHPSGSATGFSRRATDNFNIKPHADG